MALINCPECQKEISDTSEKCIGCGMTIKANNKSNNTLKIILISIGILALFLVVFYLISNFKKSDSDADLAEYIEESTTNDNFTPSQTEIDESISLDLVDDPKFDWSLVNEVDRIQEGKAYDIDGNYLGAFSDNGQKNGLWKQYYSAVYPLNSLNKVKNLAYEGTYTDGLMDGHFKHFYPNGNLKHEGYYKNGSYVINENSGIPAGGREGLHIFYFNNGRIMSKQHQENGSIKGAYQEWDKNGNCTSKGSYIYGDFIPD
jgi:antitoxin component YwqK of YwqJK toxin-antitoxin module